MKFSRIPQNPRKWWFPVIQTDFYISGGNLPLQKVWNSLGFSRSGPICRGPLRAASGFCISAGILRISWILCKKVKFHEISWNSMNFMEFADFAETAPQNHQYSLGNIGVLAIGKFSRNDEFHGKSENQPEICILCFYIFTEKLIFAENWSKGARNP